jgi:hypothetical protein
MSFVDEVKLLKPIPANVIAQKLLAAQNELAELERENGEALLTALAAGASASDLAALSTKLTAARNHVAALSTAHAAAIARDEEQARVARASLQKSQLNALRKHLEARDKHAEEFSQHIEAAALAYHAMLDKSAKAIAATPIGCTFPSSSLCEQDGLRRAVAHEIARVSMSPGNRDGRALPAPALPSLEFEMQPQKIPPMADQIKRASERVVSTLKAVLKDKVTD